MKQFILAYGSVPDKVIKEFSYSLYNKSYKGSSILSPEPYTLSNHFTTTMVDNSPSGAWLLIIAPLGATPSIYIYSFYPPQRRNHYQVDSLLETTTVPSIDQTAPDIGILLPLGLVASTTS